MLPVSSQVGRRLLPVATQGGSVIAMLTGPQDTVSQDAIREHGKATSQLGVAGAQATS